MARRSMNIVDAIAWVETTGKSLVGRHIANIYYSRNDGILYFKIKGNIIVVAEPAKRVHVTRRREPPKEFKPDPLVVLSRKYLRDARIRDIGIIGNDRIIYLESSTGYKLVVELMPRGIAALVDPEGLVLAATKYLRLRDRSIRPKTPYTPPPSSYPGIRSITIDFLEDILRGEKKLVPVLVRKAGIPGEVAEEALYRAGISTNARPDDLAREDLERILDNVLGILDESVGGKGYIVYSEGVPVEADPFYPRRFEADAYAVREKPVFDEALDELFESGAKIVDGGEFDSDVEREKERLLASLRKSEELAGEYRRMAEELRRLADIVARHYSVFEGIVACSRQYSGDEEALKSCLGKIPFTVTGEGLEIPVKGMKLVVPWDIESVDDLILYLYRKAGSLEAKAERAFEARREVERRLSELEVKVKARKLQELYKRRKRFWFEKFHYTITRNAFLVIGGKDASQNELIVRRYIEEGDLFLHADIHGAPAVVLKARGRVPAEEDVYDAGVIAVAYSKAWKAGVGAVRVFYVDARQVSLSPPTGEYLAKGGIMVYGRKRYLKPLPVRIWIGIVLGLDGVPRVLAGSEEVVRRHSIAYASLIPGEEKRLEVAKRLKEALTSSLALENPEVVLAIPDEDIASRIPGRSKITGVRRGLGEPVNYEAFE